jgi:hypothetical protein
MVQGSQSSSNGDPFSILFEQLGLDVAEGIQVEIRVASILDLIPDDLKAEIGELEVLNISVIRDSNESFIGKRLPILHVEKAWCRLTVD